MYQIGDIINFRIGVRNYTGKITKIMYPGYVYKKMTLFTNKVRYCLEDIRDKTHTFVIYESQVLDKNNTLD